MKQLLTGSLFFLFLFSFCGTLLAEDPAPAPADPQAEMTAALQAAGMALTRGPAVIDLKDQAKVALPEGIGFVPAAEAKRWLTAMGNRPGDSIWGMLVPLADEDWFFVISFADAGYIKDDDAKDWKADELLDSIREGTEEANADRRSRGIPEMEVTGWVEKPHYDAATHQLIWSLGSKTKGDTTGTDNGVNYNTLVLGREGYISMNLVAGLDAIEGLKPTAKTMLDALTFNEGKRYADFNASTDKVAEYGLAALVAGVAAKKLGLFAMLAAVLAKFAKVIFIAVAAGAAGFFKFFKREK
jgi:uncharacterized membrane-anchored protein